MPRINSVEYLIAMMTGKLNGASCNNEDIVKICDVMIYAQEVVDGFPNDDAAVNRLRLALSAAEDIEFIPIIK